MAAFAGVAVFGVLWGVGIAIALSLLNFIRRAWRPHDAMLGRVDDLKGYHDTERYPEARAAPRASCCTGSTRRSSSPTPTTSASACARLRAPATSHWVVIAAEPITDVDATAGGRSRELNDELDAAGIELAFAELKDPVRDRLRRYGIDDAFGADRFYPTSASPSPPTSTRPASTGSTGRIVNPAITPTPATDVDAGPSLRPAHEVTVTRRPTGSSAAGAPGDARHLFRPRNPEVAGEGRSAHTHGPRETIGGGR